MVAAMSKNTYAVEASARLNDKNTQYCVDVERAFLRELEGGCTAPIGALAHISDNTLTFKGCLLSLDGRTRFDTNTSIDLKSEMNHEDYIAFAKAQSQKILENGGASLMAEIKKELK